MQFANNENRNRVHINEAEKTADYFCPFCDAPMVQRRGGLNAPHFAHKRNHLCTDTWKYDMSEWHISWQSKYSKENQEISINNDLGRHRADVLINNTVIEFQHSPISPEEFAERNEFYLACGYRVIWLFDATNEYQTKLNKYGVDYYRWKYPPKMLTGFNVYGQVQVFFHLIDSKKQEGGEIVRLIDCVNGDLSKFETAPSEHYTENEFVELTSTGRVDREKDISGKDKLYHTLYKVRRVDGELERYGCPINEGGYAPLIHEYNRVACDQCPYCLEESEDSLSIHCMGRYREHLEQIETVLDNREQFLKYIAKDGMIRKVQINPSPSPAKTIIQLAEEYKASKMWVRDIERNRRVRINEDPLEMLRKYRGRIYGDICYTHGHKNGVIYGAMDSIWIMEHFVPKSKEN